MRIRTVSLGLALAAACAYPAAAQSWEAPTFFAPRAHDDIGLYIVNMRHADDLGFVAIWRQSGNINLGVRAGLAPGPQDWLVGAEFYGPLAVLGPGSPLLLSWMVGAGATFNSVTHMRIPAGLSLGANLGSGTLAVLPYVHPRVAFDLTAVEVGDEEETETEFNVDVDLGVEILLGERFVLRGGVTLGDFTVFGAGLAYRIPRPVAVR